MNFLVSDYKNLNDVTLVVWQSQVEYFITSMISFLYAGDYLTSIQHIAKGLAFNSLSAWGKVVLLMVSSM